ncbi:Ubiquitin carboxyl-terminal hydrolase [Trichinella spiralis]|uniref:Ubiquitin carboxyl-terminal hydrolase n=1 Tax=Trichinella spiralis TaxID=6334 RepID=A0ABR3KBW5_TRISP
MENSRFERRIELTGIRGGNVLFHLDIYSTNEVLPPLRGSSNRRLFLQRVLIIHNMMRQYVVRNIENMDPNEMPPSYVLTLTESFPVRIGRLANQVNRRLLADIRRRSPVRRRQHQNRMHNFYANHNEAGATARIRGREDPSPPMRD